MTDMETIEQRLSAVERALTDGTDEFESLAAASDLDEQMSTIEDRLDDIESQLTELDATTQALRGYVGNVRSVNQEVERRAETALAKVEQLEAARQATSTDTARERTPTDDETGPQQETGTRTPKTQQRTQETRQRTQERDHSHGTHTCDACGQVTEAPEQSGRHSQQEELAPDGEQTPTAWARAVGTDRRGTEEARTDGGRGSGQQRRPERQDRGRDTGGSRARGRNAHSAGDEADDDASLLAELRDVL